MFEVEYQVQYHHNTSKKGIVSQLISVEIWQDINNWTNLLEHSCSLKWEHHVQHYHQVEWQKEGHSWLVDEENRSTFVPYTHRYWHNEKVSQKVIHWPSWWEFYNFFLRLNLSVWARILREVFLFIYAQHNMMYIK